MNTLRNQLIGAVVGGAVGYFVGCIIVEIVEIKLNPFEPDYHDTEEYPKDEAILKQPENKLNVKKKPTNYARLFEDRPELSKLAAKYNGEENQEDDSTVEEEQEEQETTYDLDVVEDLLGGDDSLPIAIISRHEFNNSDLEQVFLRYYVDDVVTDQHGNPIDDPEDLLGEDALVSFGQLSGDDDIVLVRNLPKKAVYEVIQTNKFYQATPPPQQRRRSPLTKRLQENENGENT